MNAVKKFLFRLLIIFLAALIFSSCIERNDTSTIGKSQDAFIVTTSSFPSDLNNEGLKDVSGSELSYMLFNGLVKYDVNGTIVPALCKSWEVLDNGLKFKFTLNDNLYFSNGEIIDAKSIKDFFISFLQSKLIDIKYKNMLQPIFGVKEYLKTGKIDNIAINVIDNKNIEFNLNSINSSFLGILSNPVFFIKDVSLCGSDWMNNYDKIVYSGPYRINSISNNMINLIKNDKYNGKYSINKNEIIYEKTLSEHAMAMFDLNNVDAMLDVPKSEQSRLNDEQYLDKASTENFYTLNFNLKNDSVKHQNVRKAIIDAIENAKNGDLTLKNLSFTKMVNTVDTINSSQSVIDSIYDIKSLNVLLKDTNDSNNFMELLKKLLKDRYNIDLDIKYFNDDKDLLDSNYQMALLEISPDFLDEISYLESWQTGSDQNYFGFSNSQFDASLLKAINSMDNVEEIKNCQDILKGSYVTTILGYEDKFLCIKNQDNNLFLDRMGVLRFDL